MRFIALLLLILPLQAREESLDFNLSIWSTYSEDFNNEYESLAQINNVASLNTSFVTRHLAVKVNFVHNEKYERENYVPYAVATLRFNDYLIIEGGKSNEHSVLNAGTTTPKSIGASYAPLSYNDMGWENEMISSFVEPQLRYRDKNGAYWQLGILKGKAEFDSQFTDTRDLLGTRLKYQKDLSTIMYGYFDLSQTFYGVEFTPIVVDLGLGPMVLGFMPNVTERDVRSKFHAFSFSTYYSSTRISGELMYVDSMDIYAADLRVNYPITSSFTGLVAYHYNTIDFDLGKAYNAELKKGLTFRCNDHLSLTGDISYLKGKAPFLTNGQAFLEEDFEALNNDWFIASFTVQWDF